MEEKLRFQVWYENHRLPFAEDELSEDLGFNSLCAEHSSCGPSATLIVDDYVLVTKYDKLADLVDMAAWIIEALCTLPAESNDEIRSTISGIPSESKIYIWTFLCYAPLMPCIVFVVLGESVDVYMLHKRMCQGTFVVTDDGRVGPVALSCVTVIDILQKFLIAYLDDLAFTVPSVVAYDEYREYRRWAHKRLGALVSTLRER